MTGNSFLQIVLYLITLLALVKPLGWYMAQIYEDKPAGLNRWLAPVENWIYRLSGIDAKEEMRWTDYAIAMLVFNLLGALAVFALQLLQNQLPLNPANLPAVTPDSAFNTAVSFATNTNWQGYGGESTMSYLTQMLGLTVQNFVSAAAGMATLVALIRGFIRRNADTIGNFWVDLTRSTLYILLPLSLVLSVILVGQGVVQTFSSYQKVPLLESSHYVESTIDAEQKTLMKKIEITEQLIAVGPAASQVAIKQLGTNGGGFFGLNSAHPFENPTGLSNFLQMLLILLVPASQIVTFGKISKRMGHALTMGAVMTVLLLCGLGLALWSEYQTHPSGVVASWMEGKEVRFGVMTSVL
jgi:K+-transporting ATPase ATPase A chain